MSATDLGIAAVRLSWPSAVTRMSSSMRTPMPRNSGGTVRVRGDVEPGLDGEHHAGRERARRAVLRVDADVVHVHAQPVAGAVHVELLVGARLDQRRDLAGQQAQLDHARR